jgi:hypothetical protein
VKWWKKVMMFAVQYAKGASVKRASYLDIYEEIVRTFPVKFVFDFTLLSAHATRENVISGQEINCHFKNVI